MANWYPYCSNATAATATWSGWGHTYADSTAAVTWSSWNHYFRNSSITTAATAGLDYWPIWNEVYRRPSWREILRGESVEAQRALQRHRPVSAEQRAHWAERERELERKAKEDRERREAAEQKAEELLLANLTPEQRDEYKRLKRFSVHLPDGKVYRIRKGFAGNVELVEPNKAGRIERVESFCIHPAQRIPDQDTMLAQKLLLEADEPEFRRIANITRYR